MLTGFMKSKFFRIYLLPGFVFQSVVIAGGYGTGRELVEFFLNYGTIGGLLGMWLVTAVMWGVVMAASFEFARVFQVYDYRSFFKKLLGGGWVIYEILYMLLLFIVLAVVGAAAGSIMEETFGIPYMVGMILMLAAVGILTFKGSETIAGFLSWWSFVLYAMYILFIAMAFAKFGGEIAAGLAKGEILPGWALGGFKYALYNLGVLPGVLFALKHIETRQQAIVSGFISSAIAIIPGFLFFLALAGGYPEVLDTEVPALFLLNKIGALFLLTFFQIVLFGTLIETGTGFIHAVNERINSVYHEKKMEMPTWLRPVVAIVLLIFSAGLATFGLVALIAKGYGTISWGFFIAHVIPVLTIGIAKIKQAEAGKHSA